MDVDGRGNTHSADSNIETDTPLSDALQVNEDGTVPAGKGGGGPRRRGRCKAGVNVSPDLPPARAYAREASERGGKTKTAPLSFHACCTWREVSMGRIERWRITLA